jgi:hypothetical protein
VNTYTYITREYFVGEWRDVKASIEAKAGMKFVVECISELDKAIRCFETHEQAKKYGQAFNRKADRKAVGASYQIIEMNA